MIRNVRLSFILVLISCSLLIAQEWWETIPSAQWSDEQASIILEFSPWAHHSSVFLRRVDAQPTFMEERSGEHPGGADYPEYYIVRLLTALPVREAMLLNISRSSGMVASANEYYKSNAEAEQARLSKFVVSNPDSVIVKGDEENIIVSLTLIPGLFPPVLKEGHIVPQGVDSRFPGVNPKFLGVDSRFPRVSLMLRQGSDTGILSETDLSKLLADTSLETNTGKHIKPFTYKPPGHDGLGAKFLFKRRMPDGTSFITTDDKILRFETRLDGLKVKVKFDLTKMMYKGKLEY